MPLKKRKIKDARVFLGWSQPPLLSASEWLCRKYSDRNAIDMSNCLLVLPTARSRQRILQLIADYADSDQQTLTPPEIVTIGEFPEHLYDVEKKLASGLCQQIAWSKALMEFETEQVEILFKGASEKQSLEEWQPYAQLISDLHRRLGNDVWSFSSVVREVLEIDNKFREIDRWRVLESIQKKYYQILTAADLWDKQAARNVAVRRELCRADKQIIMVGTADLSRAAKLMLSQIRDQMTVLVAAPRSRSQMFDEFGGLITEAWLHVEIKFPNERIRIVDRIEDQAFAACQYLSSLEDRFAADQITIGVPDRQVLPQLERTLAAVGLQFRDLKGVAVRDSSPVKLIFAILEYLEQQNFSSFATMVRHPILFEWICKQMDDHQWLDELDDIQSEVLPDRIAVDCGDPFGDAKFISARFDGIPRIAERFTDRINRLNAVHALIAKLLTAVNGDARPMAEWIAPWLDVLSQLFNDVACDPDQLSDQLTQAACREIAQSLRDLGELPEEWETTTSASKAIRMALDSVSDWNVISDATCEAIEIAGWLDLPLDDSAVVVVTGMNDEHVPASENGHLFLPDKLCKKLGLVDNDHRYARDAYALTLLNAVRSDVMLITGRRDIQGEPKKPSRLLFADDDDVMVERANAFFSFEGKSNSRFWLGDPESAANSQQIPIPEPLDAPISNELSVTSFREYIKCPYRFYLTKILRLDAVDDSWQEMDARIFGNLAHEVLESFGLDSVKDSTETDEIYSFLSHQLDKKCEQFFVSSKLPAVQLQIEQLRMRLRKFAEVQAKRAADGWRIVSVEENNRHAISVDGNDFMISGTIDRVDVHTTSGRVEIWDYKTSDKGDEPRRVHRTRDDWKDLQLPLYRHLAKEIDVLKQLNLEDVGLGFILLPRDLERVGFYPLVCSTEELEQADQQVVEIIRNLRRSKYWPPREKPPLYSENLSAICQDFIFEPYAIENGQANTQAAPIAEVVDE